MSKLEQDTTRKSGSVFWLALVASSLQLSRESAPRNECSNNMRKIGFEQMEHRFVHSNKTQARIDLEDSLKLLSEVNKSGTPLEGAATPRK